MKRKVEVCPRCGKQTMLKEGDTSMCTNCGYNPDAPQDITTTRQRVLLVMLLLVVLILILVMVPRVDAQAESAQIERRTVLIDGYLLPYAPDQPYSDCTALFIQGDDVTEQFVAHREDFAHYIGLAYVMRMDGYAVWAVRSLTDDTLLYYAGWWWDIPATRLNDFIVGHPSCGVYRVTGDYHNELRSR